MRFNYSRNLYLYVFLVASAVLVAVFDKFLPARPISIFLAINAAFLIPGILLSRIVRLKLAGFVGQLILFFTCGFIFNMGLCLLAVIFGLAIAVFIKFYLIAGVLLLIAAIIYELLRPYGNLDLALRVNLRNWFKLSNLLYLVLFFIILMVIIAVDVLGTNLRGDPLYHMSIMRKAYEGLPMTVQNLSYLKNDFPIAYVVPVWHVFLTLMAKLTQSSIFVLYREASTSLVLYFFIVWYFLLSLIFKKRWLVLFALILGALSYYSANSYLYTRLVVNDTFGNLILLPLAFAWALNYIYDQQSTRKHLIILSLFVALLGVTHWLQYFYYMTGMGFFALLYLAFNFRTPDFWPGFRRVLLSIFTNLILVVPILLYWFFVGQNSVSKNFEMFETVQRDSHNDRFTEFGPYSQMAYVLLPSIILFLRKNKIFLFLLALFLVGPVVFNFPGLYGLLKHYLSHLFVNRFYANLGEQTFLIWAIALGFILVLIDRLLAKLKTSRFVFWGINIGLAVFIIYLIFLQITTDKIDVYFYLFFQSPKLHLWLNNNYLWLILTTAIISMVIFIVQKYRFRIAEFFSFDEIRNGGTITLLALISIIFVATPSFDHQLANFQKEAQSRHFLTASKDPMNSVIAPGLFGGWETIDFIKANVPAKAVLDSNSTANYTLPTLLDIHMASWTNNDDVDPTRLYRNLYEAKTPINEKLTLLKKGDMDYVMYVFNKKKDPSPLDILPQYFTKIYQTASVAIYQVNKEQVKLDLK